MARDRVRSRAPMLAVLVTALVAFLASSIGAVPAVAASKRAGASIEAPRLATVGIAKPTPRKADRTPGATAIPRVSAPVPSYRVSLAAPPPPASWTPPAKARSELMVFLI